MEAAHTEKDDFCLPNVFVLNEQNKKVLNETSDILQQQKI